MTTVRCLEPRVDLPRITEWLYRVDAQSTCTVLRRGVVIGTGYLPAESCMLAAGCIVSRVTRKRASYAESYCIILDAKQRKC